jgi:uncharacterized protein involved in cysteine biosynthesis
MFITGLVILPIGICFVIFAQNIWNFTGSIDFVEKYFPGNTRAFIQLLGIVMVLLGMLFITGLSGWLIQPISDTVGNIFGN